MESRYVYNITCDLYTGEFSDRCFRAVCVYSVRVSHEKSRQKVICCTAVSMSMPHTLALDVCSLLCVQPKTKSEKVKYHNHVLTIALNREFFSSSWRTYNLVAWCREVGCINHNFSRFVGCAIDGTI